MIRLYALMLLLRVVDLRATPFEKILGWKPSFSDLKLLYRNALPPVTSECIKECNQRDDCGGFILHYDSSSCYSHKITENLDNLKGVFDPKVAWFVKSNLRVKCIKDWIFEIVIGAILVDSDLKVLSNVMSREECQKYCINETDFQCRSANFKLLTTVTGICSLSRNDRHLLPNSYRVSTFNDVYLENQCSNVTNEFCDYEEYENSTLSHQDVLFPNRTKNECQNLCDTYTNFNCRSYSLHQKLLSKETNRILDCYLSSEDSIVFGPKLLQTVPGGSYHERARCLNVSVHCTDYDLSVKYQPEVDFKGRVYMQGYSDQKGCYSKGHGFETVILSVPVLGNNCGLMRAKSSLHNRTLISSTLVIQYNNLIQTQGDRLIRVGCIYGNETKVLIGTGVNITSRPYTGSTILNMTTGKPNVRLKILDFLTQMEATDTQIGQELEMIIEIQPIDSQYDIWASHLIAMTDRSDESIFLLDDRGCPTNPTIFPSMTKIRTNRTNKLVAVFRAFKFSSSPVIRFSVIVQFCVQICRPVYCGNNTPSFIKAKRDTTALDTINGTTVVNTLTNFTDNEIATVYKIPLEFSMFVRDPKISTDKYIYDEHNKILIAGYDLVTNEVCIDFSLLVGVIITWALIQIIFVTCCVVLVRRYKRYYEHESLRQSLEQLHRNFGLGFSNLDNRRVHWADTDMT